MRKSLMPGDAAALIMSALTIVVFPAAAQAQTGDVAAMRAELAAARADIEQQRQALEQRSAQLKRLEARLAAMDSGAAAAAPADVAASIVPPSSNTASAAVEQVGQRPVEQVEKAEVALIDEGAKVITRPGQLTAEWQVDYAQANRSRALFRGFGGEAVYFGSFDINESRQDIVSSALGLRYGLSGGLELGVRVPFVHRSDVSILAPVRGTTTNDSAATIDGSSKGNGIGDVELSARYQLNNARDGRPYFIGNVQVIAPTGSSPFAVPRDENGVSTRAATGAGFWGVGGGITAIVPTDPAAIFAAISYVKNFGRSVDTPIPPLTITRVNPGDSLSFSGGFGLALNQRMSFNLGYAHSWVFGTTTHARQTGGAADTEIVERFRDLQLGRFLFGITYRVNNRTSINWAVELGATSDAADVRTSLRVPLILLTGG